MVIESQAEGWYNNMPLLISIVMKEEVNDSKNKKFKHS